MSDSKRVARVGALVVVFGVWSAVVAHPGLASADPTAETSSSTSTGEDPDRGVSDSRADPGMASSEGSTPSAGAGPVEHGSGSGDEPGPDPSGSTVRSDEPVPGVVISSSGGALTSGQHDQSSGDSQSASGDSGSQQTSAPATGSEAPVTEAAPVTATPVIVVTATPVSVEPSAVVTPPAASSIGSAAQTTPAEPGLLAGSHSHHPTMTRISVIPGAPVMLGAGEGDDTSPADGPPPQATTHVETLSTRTSSVPDVGSESPLMSLRIVTSVLAAALAPFVMPVPGGPVEEPALWAIFAWARRQSEGKALTQPGLVVAPRHTEMVGDGRLTGASRAADEPDTATNAPAERLDVRAPEAVVTGSIDVGDGLTYGLAVVGDRLYVLNSSYDSQDNGHLKMIDTATGRVAGSIEVGRMPYALAVSGRSLYVGNAGDGTVSVVDVATNRVVEHIDVGATPYGLVATDDRLYVADHAGTVSVIDLFDNIEIARIPVEGDPFAVAATVDHVYVTDYAGGTVAVFDQTNSAASDTISAVSTNLVGVTAYPYSAAVVGGRLYVVNSATNALTIIDRSVTTAVHVDPATRAVDAIPSGAAPVDMIVRGDRLYVSNVNCGSVAVIDASSNQPVETVRVGIAPGLMAATPDGRKLYVADVMGGTVRVITSVHPGAGDATA